MQRELPQILTSRPFQMKPSRPKFFALPRPVLAPALEIDEGGSEFVHQARQRFIEVLGVTAIDGRMIVEHEIALAKAALLQIDRRRTNDGHPIRGLVAEFEERFIRRGSSQPTEKNGRMLGPMLIELGPRELGDRPIFFKRRDQDAKTVHRFSRGSRATAG
jgi:hypothetical protein